MQTPQDGGGLPAAEEPFDDLDQIEGGDEPIEADEEPVEDEPVETEGDEPAPAPAAAPRRPGRRERQNAELRTLREQTERLQREIDGFRSQQQRPAGPDPAEQARRDQAEREHVATLDYGQQMQYWRDKDRREYEQRLGQTQLATAQQIDKFSWDASCRMDPVKAQFADQVERLFQDELRAGRAQSREVLFTYIYGQEALRQRQTRGASQRQDAARRVAAQTTRPGALRSDGAAAGQRPRANDQSYEASLARVKGRSLW